MPPPLLSVCTALRRAHTSNTFTCFCSKDFAFVPGRDRGRFRLAYRSWRRVQPIPGASGHASTGGCAAGCCTCACCCPAAAQRASAGATSGAGCAKSGAGSRAGAAWTWCSTAHVERAVRQRREQRRLPGSGVSNCAFVGATPSPSPASRRSRGTCSSGSTRHNEVGRSLCCG